MALGNATPSKALKKLVLQLEGWSDTADWFDEHADMTSTAGYDNDGSTGPEMVDNGIGLAFACRAYDPKATIFYAHGGDQDSWVTCYFVYGKDEEDAIRRFRKAIAENAEANDLSLPPEDFVPGGDEE